MTQVPETHRLTELETKLLNALQLMLRFDNRGLSYAHQRIGWAQKATPKELRKLFATVRKITGGIPAK